jgi:hypothetical protein
MGQLAQVCVCLEASLPFRPDPLEYVQDLYERFTKLNKRYQLKLADMIIEETIQRGVDIQNRVLGNMVTTDLAEFILHTWSLLPEQDAALRRNGLYTQVEFYTAIDRLLTATQGIQEKAKKQNLFIGFRGFPADDEVSQFNNQVTANLKYAQLYLRIRLVTTAITSSLAIVTGGDTPYSFFFGDQESSTARSHPYCSPFTQLGESLLACLESDPVNNSTAGVFDVPVYDVLKGSSDKQRYESRHTSILAAYMYRRLGDLGVSQYARLCPSPKNISNPLYAWQFLRSTPAFAIQRIVDAIIPFAVTRVGPLKTVVVKLLELEKEHTAKAQWFM